MAVQEKLGTNDYRFYNVALRRTDPERSVLFWGFRSASETCNRSIRFNSRPLWQSRVIRWLSTNRSLRRFPDVVNGIRSVDRERPLERLKWAYRAVPWRAFDYTCVAIRLIFGPCQLGYDWVDPQLFLFGGTPNLKVGVPISCLLRNPHNRCDTAVHGHWYLVDSWA